MAVLDSAPINTMLSSKDATQLFTFFEEKRAVSAENRESKIQDKHLRPKTMSCLTLHNEVLEMYVTMQDACFMHCLKRRNGQPFALKGHCTVCEGSGIITECGQEPD